MPKSLDTLGEDPVIKALLLAAAKVGKTTTIGGTASKALGKGYVACCSTQEHLRGLKNFCEADKLPVPDFDLVKSNEDMEAAIGTFRKGVKDGTYKWGMVDDFSVFVAQCLTAAAAASNGNGRIYWDSYQRYVQNVVLRWLDVKAPIFVTMHYIESSAEMEGQVAKAGPGIVPAIQGATLRQWIPSQFPQVIWMEKRKGGVRVFRLSVDGMTGPGCNNLPEDVTDIRADVGVLLSALKGEEVEDLSGSAEDKKKGKK